MTEQEAISVLIEINAHNEFCLRMAINEDDYQKTLKQMEAIGCAINVLRDRVKGDHNERQNNGTNVQ